MTGRIGFKELNSDYLPTFGNKNFVSLLSFGMVSFLRQT